MGWGDIGAYGGGVAVGAPAPEMDMLADEGLRLTSTYAQPTCTLSRAALLTGRLPACSDLTRSTLTGENPKSIRGRSRSRFRRFCRNRAIAPRLPENGIWARLTARSLIRPDLTNSTVYFGDF